MVVKEGTEVTNQMLRESADSIDHILDNCHNKISELNLSMNNLKFNAESKKLISGVWLEKYNDTIDGKLENIKIARPDGTRYSIRIDDNIIDKSSDKSFEEVIARAQKALDAARMAAVSSSSHRLPFETAGWLAICLFALVTFLFFYVQNHGIDLLALATLVFISLCGWPLSIAEEHWWKGDSRSELSVALGRVGARKNQSLILNSQDQVHALVAGQTGFGKSTLFHVMITHLCLTYSPKELELYLIDFKKGVEFKPYAEHHLPHARVIAIDSEREFGLSVLRGLDAEFKRRGDAFRSTIEQNIAGYRKAHPSEVCPRIVLIVDEFQEFFTEDDAIAREAGLLLDRLVRQGRNVGIHVILGSQTLTNAGQLAHSTISQIAIRIALHCSEADSRLILAEDNPGARLLNRPGEAIYNTAGGRKGAEDQFQTVWLSSEAREYYLGRIEHLAADEPARPQRVFEGNALAEINPAALVTMTRDTVAKRAPKGAVPIWLGEAIAVQEDPITARFRRQSGANLLLAYQQEDAALGMLTVALAGLVAQLPPVRAESGWQHPVLILDFSGGDGTHAGYYADLSDRWAGRVRRVTRRQVPEVLDALAGEVQRRIDADDDTGSGTQGAAPVFVVLHGLQRARDLRQDDSYGLSAFGTEPAALNPGQQFAAILRDGPDVGVHTVAWCDTMTNLNRTLDRRVLREFGMRVVMQMSTEDSANLIDSPAASKLGAYRALLYNEEEGTLEKFHPYGVPSAQWLSEVGQHFV